MSQLQSSYKEGQQRLSCRISSEMGSELEALARSQGKSRSALMREAVADYLQRQKRQPSYQLD